jgi:hypothetical protein
MPKEMFPKWDEFYEKWQLRNHRIFKPVTKGSRKMTEEQVIWARENIGKYGYATLAHNMGFSRDVIEAAVKGQTFRHLNMKHRPQR